MIFIPPRPKGAPIPEAMTVYEQWPDTDGDVWTIWTDKPGGYIRIGCYMGDGDDAVISVPNTTDLSQLLGMVASAFKKISETPNG